MHMYINTTELQAHSLDIWKFLGLDVKQDHRGCPPYICTCCQLKLKRSTKMKNKEVRTGMVTFCVPDFPDPSLHRMSGMWLLLLILRV